MESELAKGTSSTRMDNTLGDAFMVETLNLLWMLGMNRIMMGRW